MDGLCTSLGGKLSPEALLAARKYVKSRYVRQAAYRLRAEFDSDVSKTVDKLCSLSGVGLKTAFLVLTCHLGYVCALTFSILRDHARVEQTLP